MFWYFHEVAVHVLPRYELYLLLLGMTPGGNHKSTHNLRPVAELHILFYIISFKISRYKITEISIHTSTNSMNNDCFCKVESYSLLQNIWFHILFILCF